MSKLAGKCFVHTLHMEGNKTSCLSVQNDLKDLPYPEVSIIATPYV